MAVLPDRLVFKADDEVAWRRLELEAEVISRFAVAVGGRIPHVLDRDEETRTQVRKRILGVSGREVERLIFGVDAALTPRERYDETCPLTAAGATLAADLGRTLARIHGAVPLDDALRLGVPANQPRLGDATADILRAHARSPLLEQALRSARTWLTRVPSDTVVVHGDPHLHNLAADAESGELLGIFDFDETACADRRHDLAYLHSNGLPFARVALRAYAEVGPPVDEREIGRFHVICALDHFSFVAPDSDRFPRIIDWATTAAASFAPEWCA